MKKKICCLILSAVLAFSVSACGENASENAGASSSSDSVVSKETSVDASSDQSVAVIEAKEKTYVLMNIPYGEFFAAEFEGGENVDAVTSATMNKAANEKLVAGTYHLEDNSKILGVTYPVLVSDQSVLDASKKVADEAALFAATDYSYAELTETPEYYKELSVDTTGKYAFGKAEGKSEEIAGDTAKVNAATRWGDYEIDLDQSLSELSVFAASIHTTDGASYGFRALENLWRGYEIAFATTEGYKEPHGNTVAYQPYADLPGKTIDEITLYTNSGIKKVNAKLYLPLKFENSITIKDAKVDAKSTEVSLEGYPAEYEFAYEVTGASDDIVCDGKTISWGSAIAGPYTLKVSDASGVYAPYSTSFTLTTEKAVAVAAEDGISKAKDASDAEFEAFIKNISGYVVNGTEYAGSGKRGVKIIGQDGVADKTQSSVFSEVGEYEVVIKSTGFPNVTIKVNVTEVVTEENKENNK